MPFKYGKWDFRDVSWGLKKLRQFLLGRKHDIPNLHGRFLPRLSPRTIPLPEIPRGPCSINKYYDQWYCDRSAKDGVKPPVVAPIGDAPPSVDCTGKTQALLKPAGVLFTTPPTPGIPWWWDGHNYYEWVPKSQTPPLDPVCPPEAMKTGPVCEKQKPSF